MGPFYEDETYNSYEDRGLLWEFDKNDCSLQTVIFSLGVFA
jgi:hypothetical protein